MVANPFEVCLDRIETGRDDAQMWVDEHFELVPGEGEFNFLPRLGVESGWTYFCNHGRYTLKKALLHVAERHGGIKRLVTDDMRKRAAIQKKAWGSIDEAVSYLKQVYSIRPMDRQLLFTRNSSGRDKRSVWPSELSQMRGFPDVVALAGKHGPLLGQTLLASFKDQYPYWRSW